MPTDPRITIANSWDKYKLHVVPSDAGPIQLNEARNAFYAGAASLFASIMISLNEGEEATEEDLAYIGSINDELREFGLELVAKAKAAGQWPKESDAQRK